jgi:hypothetical protein
MEGSYIKDLANRGGPELCVGVPRGRSEALARGAYGRAIEPRKTLKLGCRRALNCRKATPLAALSRAVSGPRGVREPLHVCDLSLLENRESPRSPVLVDDAPPFAGRGVACQRVAGRTGKAQAVTP